jgi:phage shock protein A
VIEPEMWKVLAGGGATVSVLFCVLLFLRYFAAQIKGIADDFRGAVVQMQRDQRDHEDRRDEQYMTVQKAFQEQIQKVTESHMALTREAVGAIKAVEKTVEGSTGTIRQVEKRLEDVSVAVRSLEALVNARRTRREEDP